MSKKFYPSSTGMTKAEVIQMIEERIEDDSFTCTIGSPDINRLSDERMQEFVDRWVEVFDDGLAVGPDHAALMQEDVIEQLAQELDPNYQDDEQ